MSQPENDLFEPEIQPNLPENCQISALFGLKNLQKGLGCFVNLGHIRRTKSLNYDKMWIIQSCRNKIYHIN